MAVRPIISRHRQPHNPTIFRYGNFQKAFNQVAREKEVRHAGRLVEQMPVLRRDHRRDYFEAAPPRLHEV